TLVRRREGEIDDPAVAVGETGEYRFIPLRAAEEELHRLAPNGSVGAAQKAPQVDLGGDRRLGREQPAEEGEEVALRRRASSSLRRLGQSPRRRRGGLRAELGRDVVPALPGPRV